MATFKVMTKYKDGTTRMLETKDGKKAMQEAASCAYSEDQSKTVTLEQDGETIWSEKVKSWKEQEAEQKALRAG
jgi:hypothetical protein